jgi:hypothetical protein
VKRLLIPFAIVYGQVSAAVISISFVLYGLREPGGQRLCASFGLSPSACGAVTGLAILLAFALSIVLTLSRFRRGGDW